MPLQPCRRDIRRTGAFRRDERSRARPSCTAPSSDGRGTARQCGRDTLVVTADSLRLDETADGTASIRRRRRGDRRTMEAGRSTGPERPPWSMRPSSRVTVADVSDLEFRDGRLFPDGAAGAGARRTVLPIRRNASGAASRTRRGAALPLVRAAARRQHVDRHGQCHRACGGRYVTRNGDLAWSASSRAAGLDAAHPDHGHFATSPDAPCGRMWTSESSSREPGSPDSESRQMSMTAET